jgi:dihydroorotase
MRTHIYHITTANEIGYFCNNIPVSEKQVTAEVCVHHLHFTAKDYAKHGNFLKCNPAIKDEFHKNALWEGLLDDRFDVIATDHAPHSVQEKFKSYLEAPSGVPFVQHGFQLMLDYVKQGRISLETVIQKMCHSPADCFRIENRGYIREGYWADLVLFDLLDTSKVEKNNIAYKCGHSPLLGRKFQSAITHTFVNGVLLYEYGTFIGKKLGMHMTYVTK